MSVLPSLFLTFAMPAEPPAQMPLWLLGHWRLASKNSPLCSELVVTRQRDGMLSGVSSGYFKLASSGRWRITPGAVPSLTLNPGTRDAATYTSLRSAPGSIEFGISATANRSGFRFTRAEPGDLQVTLIGADGGRTTYRYSRTTDPCEVLPPRRPFQLTR